jgi:hypothetical protein
VIIGTSGNNLERDRRLEPDVVLPRRWWRRGSGELRRFLERGEFERRTFPIPDLPSNTTPALSRSPWILDTHRFRTPALDDPAAALTLYERTP